LEDAPPHEVPDGIPWKIVLGIDPGTTVVGYGALVLRPEGPTLLAAGALRAPRRGAAPVRLGHILAALEDLLGRLKPDVVVVERAFAGENVQSAIRIGEGRGLALASAARRGLEVIEMAPAVAKKALVGNGGADKEQVARMVAAELGLAEPPRPHDATDALALALTYVHRSRAPGRL
jgi:crossover junction endodeoxyribonuclease RuvC